MEAKAKRLARFKVELSQNVQGSPDFADQLDSANRNEESIAERKKYAGNQSAELTGDFSHAHVLSDFDGHEPSTIIIGMCPDMCPGMSLNHLIHEQSYDSSNSNAIILWNLGLHFIFLVKKKLKNSEKKK